MKFLKKTESKIKGFVLSLHSFVKGKYSFFFVFVTHSGFGHSITCNCIIPINKLFASASCSHVPIKFIIVFK